MNMLLSRTLHDVRKEHFRQPPMLGSEQWKGDLNVSPQRVHKGLTPSVREHAAYALQ